MFRHSSLFQFKNGDHTCVFYRSVDELMQVLNPYIADGLKRSERCFCAQKPEVLKRLVYDLRYFGIDAEREILNGALDLRSLDDTYLPNGRFEPVAMMGMLMRSIRDAHDQGFESFRSAGEMSWSVEGHDLCDMVVEYEKLVDEYYPGKPAIGLCQYQIEKFAPEVLQSVVQAHRMEMAEAAANSSFSSMSIRNGKWTAEVVADKTQVNPCYYYVVQNREPQEVIGWGVAPNFESATTRIDQLAGSCVTQESPANFATAGSSPLFVPVSE
jgi:hypothetical protein